MISSVDRAVEEFQSQNHDKWLGMGTPWFTEGSKAWLEANIRGTDRVLEFGGGRSTIFWAARAELVTSVEASPDWFLWIFMQLYNNPSLMKKVRLHFVPCEWNPDFKKGRRRYWTENRGSLHTGDIAALERDLITSRHEGHNVMLFDGSLRDPVFVYQVSKANFDEVELIVVDNTELSFNAYVSGYLIPPEFERLDFVAGSHDEVPSHQNGKHITTIFVRKDRLKSSTPVETEVPQKLSERKRREFLLNLPLEDKDVRAKIEAVSQKINGLVGGGFEPRLFV